MSTKLISWNKIKRWLLLFLLWFTGL
ncbi:MAG: hypothetical protein RL213_1861, partial [Bacteroidota bacterium]